ARCVRHKDACVAKAFDLLRGGRRSTTRKRNCETSESAMRRCVVSRALRQAPRRSASQVPEHSPPGQEPEPAVPESRPEPFALLLPALTVTVTWPLLATLPLMVAGLEPSASRAPLRMRIGYP